MVAERIAEALAGTQSIAVLGDEVRDDLFRAAAEWGFLLQSLDARDLVSFGDDHPLWRSKSKAHWLFMIENAHLLTEDEEDALLDLLFDGCHALPENTLIAAHFSQRCNLSEALSDQMVPITYIEITRSEMVKAVARKLDLPIVSTSIARIEPADLRGIPLAA